jgi:hypothetical protein
MQLIFILNESKMIIFHVLSCRHEIVRYNFCQFDINFQISF